MVPDETRDGGDEDEGAGRSHIIDVVSVDTDNDKRGRLNNAVDVE